MHVSWIRNTVIFFINAILVFFIHSVAFAQSYNEDMSIGLLETLDITTETTVSADSKVVTRGEFAKISVKLAGYDTNSSIETSFSDIAGNKYADYIKTALYFGIISDNDIFRPDDPTTRDEAIIMTVSALGGRNFAEMLGQDINGFYEVAKLLGLTDGCNNSIMTGSDTIKMLDNALRTYCIEYNPSGKGYSLNPSELYIHRTFDVYQYEGVVEANSYAGMYEYEGAGRDAVLINGKRYMDYIGGGQYLGRAVYYYVNSEDSDIVYIYPKYNDDVMTVDAFDFSALSSGKFSYYTANNKEKNVKISAKPIFIINNTFVPENEIPEKINYGEYTLVDSDNDGIFDVFLITDLSVYKIKNISERNSTIYFYETEDSINLDSDELDLFIYINGEPAKFSDLQIGDIVTIEQSSSTDLNYIIIKVYTNNISCQVTSTSADNTNVGLDGENYQICPNVYVRLGAYGTAYFDDNERCIYFDIDISVVYGYLSKIYRDESEENVFAKIYTERGRWVDLQLNNNVKLNGKNGCSPDEIYTFIAPNGVFKHQMISYKIDSNNKITEINTVQTQYTRWTDTEQGAIDNGLLVQTEQASSAIYRETTANFGGTIFIQPDTIIFMLAAGTGDTISDNNISVIKSGELVNGQTYPSVTAYNQTKYGTTPVVLCINPDTVYTYSDLAVVETVAEGIDGDDNVTNVLNCFYKGGNYSFFLKEADSNVFQKGDVFSLALDSDGYINSYEIHCRLGDDDIKPIAVGTNVNANSYILGVVRTINHSFGMVTIQRDSSVDTCVLDSSAEILVYDKSLRKPKTQYGTINDITEGQTVFLKNSYGKVKTAIVVYDGE